MFLLLTTGATHQPFKMHIVKDGSHNHMRYADDNDRYIDEENTDGQVWILLNVKWHVEVCIYD